MTFRFVTCHALVTWFLLIAGNKVDFTHALNNITMLTLGDTMATMTPFQVASTDVRLPLMLKFHVSGQLDSHYAAKLSNYKVAEKLSDVPELLDAKLTKMFKSESIYDVHINSVRRNEALITFTTTLYFNTDTTTTTDSIKQLIEDDDDFQLTDVYVFEYCVRNTCNGGNGHCEFTNGNALCQCKPGFNQDRCSSRTYPDKDYFVAGTICGVILAVIVALLVVFCRTYKFNSENEPNSNSHASSVRTNNSSSDPYSSGQEVYVKKPYENGFLTYKNISGSSRTGTGIINKAFVIDSSSDRNLGDTIYKKQLKKFFEDAPQMRLNNAIISRNNSFAENDKLPRAFTENDKLGTKKTINSLNSYKSPQRQVPMILNGRKENQIT